MYALLSSAVSGDVTRRYSARCLYGCRSRSAAVGRSWWRSSWALMISKFWWFLGLVHFAQSLFSGGSGQAPVSYQHHDSTMHGTSDKIKKTPRDRVLFGKVFSEIFICKHAQIILCTTKRTLCKITSMSCAV